MTRDEIKAMQAKLGVEVDGFWGPKSIFACQAHLKKMMPAPHPFPTQRDVPKFYGKHGEKNGYTPPMAVVETPFPLYYDGTTMIRIRAHELVADSLARVFERLVEIYPDAEAQSDAGINVFDGIYNPRPMRGGSSWSMHSWAIAIDLDASRNQNNSNWPYRSHMPLEVMECFAKEGWLSAGAFWGRDAMHFQATKI
jgi:hypothetical protein